MELRHLRYFVAVAEALSFRRAAERLRVAQPALSKQIRDLEEDVGARLLDRNTARVRLTDAGSVVLEEARVILLHADRLRSSARDAAHGRRGRLTIGNIGSLTTGFLPASLTAFHTKFPEVELNVVELRSREQAAALRSGRIQVGLLAGGAAPFDDDLARVEILRSPLMLALPARHPLARRRVVTLADVAKARHLVIAAEHGNPGHGELVRELFLRRAVPAPPIKVVDTLESLLALVAGNHGMSVLPQRSGRENNPNIVMKPLPITGEDASFPLSAVWRRDDASQLVRNFITVMEAEARRVARGSGGRR